MKQKPYLKQHKYFDGKRFYNAFPATKKRKLRHILYWLTFGKPKRWPKKVTYKPQKVPLKHVKGHHIIATFVNHSTMLIQAQGLNILTDPIWSERASPVKWLGPKRVASPGINFEDLPPIDIVLISHNHYDHMDLPTIKLLNKTHHPRFYVSLGNLKFLHKRGIKNVSELDWWEEVVLPKKHLKLTFVPAQHTSGRGVFDQNKTLWGGFIIEFPWSRIYFAGDTSYGLHFKHFREKFGPIDLALLPIGSYQPSWFMSSVHMSPREAVQAHLDLEASQSIGMHFGTFRLGNESIDEPVRDLKKALKAHAIPSAKFAALRPGDHILMDL